MDESKISQEVHTFGSVNERISPTQIERSEVSSAKGVLPWTGGAKRCYGKQLELKVDYNCVGVDSAHPRLVVQTKDSLLVFENTEDIEDQVPTTITGLQNRVRNSVAYAAEIGLMVLANGEDKVKVLTTANTLVRAGIEAPTAAPTVADNGGGTLTNNEWVVYQYVYAATSAYPLVENTVDINGDISPRGNPSPSSATYQITGAGDRQLQITVTKTTRSDITKIWLFRTQLFSSQTLAETAAAAGLLYFIGEATNDGIAGTTTVDDNTLTNIGNSPIELDNFEAPQFRYVIWEDPYFWGFANEPYIATATWDNTHTGATGLVTVSGTDNFFEGRDGQNIRFEGIVTGGYDNAGTFKFLRLTSTTATVYTTDSATPVALPSTGSGTITIQGPPAILYRSKYRNPFSWGFTQVIGSVTLPQLWSLKVGGGFGTAIAVIPDQPTLKVDCEAPAQCVTFNLQAASTDQFAGTKRIISKVYSTSSHFSQFVAQVEGALVLWSMDYKNFVILQSNGVSVTPVAGPLPLLLRRLTRDKTRQKLSHGIYDPETELNVMWLTTDDSAFNINICIYQHGPTGAWGIVDDYDILCSSSIEDENGGGRQTWVGTEAGFIARAFVKDVYNNFLPSSGLYTGTVASATSTTISRNPDDGNFNTTDDGLVGNYVLVVSSDGLDVQLGLISQVTSSSLAVELVVRNNGSEEVTFDPVPSSTYKFYIGVIECRLRKYFDFGDPALSKYIPEAWVTAQNTTADDIKLLYYPERTETPTYQIDLAKDPDTDAYYQKFAIPSKVQKTVGIEVIERGYDAFEFNSLALKPSP